MRDRARPSSLSPASSRIAPTDSSRARSMKAQVLTTRQSASAGVAATSTPARASMPSISSESTWFLGQASVVRCTFMAGRHYTTAQAKAQRSEPRWRGTPHSSSRGAMAAAKQDKVSDSGGQSKNQRDDDKRTKEG